MNRSVADRGPSAAFGAVARASGNSQTPRRSRQPRHRDQPRHAPFPAEQAPERKAAQSTSEPIRPAGFAQKNLQSEPKGEIQHEPHDGGRDGRKNAVEPEVVSEAFNVRGAQKDPQEGGGKGGPSRDDGP